MCSQYLAQGEYCEKCAEIFRNEEFVKTHSTELNKPEIEAATVQKDKDVFIPPTRSKDKDKAFIWLGVGGAFSMIFVSLLLYSFPLLFESAEAASLRLSEQALEDCRLVFEEIGYYLADGETPPDSMRCEESNIPNTVSRRGGIVRISHPNPQVHGLSEIYVTSASHEVIYVE